MTVVMAQAGLVPRAHITELIDQLVEADRRLDELLGGQVDWVTDGEGRTMVLRRAQGELHQEELARQAAVLNALPASITLLDAQGRLISVNAAWRKFAEANGMAAAGMGLGMDYLAVCDGVIGPDASQAQVFAAGLRRVLAGTLPAFDHEYACHSPEKQRWFRARITPLAAGSTSGAVVMHTDVSENRMAAQALAVQLRTTARREAMLTRMLSSISDFTYILDREGRFVFANAPLLQLWGLTLEQAVGQTFDALGYPQALADTFKAQLDEVFVNGTVVTGETPYKSPAGVDGCREYIFSPALAADGTVDFVVGSTRDITLRKQHEETLRLLNTQLEIKVGTGTTALRRQEALFKTLAEQAPGIIWTLDAAATRVTYMNPAGSLLLGHPSNLEDSPWLPLVHPDDVDATQREMTRAVATRTVFQCVRRLRASDGNYRVMAARAAPVCDEEGAVDFWVGLDMDVTELKEVEAALRASNHELEGFSYAVAHDLRSPLGIIAGFTRLLERDLGQGASPRQLHLLSRIRTGVQQMDDVSEGLLALAGLSRKPIMPELTDLSKVAQEALALLAEREPDRKVVVDVQPGVLALCDRRMMHSLLGNLLGNAWKFSAQVSPARISFSAHAVGDAQGLMLYRVQDNGAGFDMDYAAKLFVPFQRLHTTEQFEGTGIGLATVKKIVERHGGTISARAHPGNGACFEFTLKADAAPAAPHAEILYEY